MSITKKPGSTAFSPKMKYLIRTLVTLRKDKRKFKKGLSGFENVIREYFPEMIDMIRGIADGSVTDYEDVLFLNIATDSMLTCSIWGASENATKNGNLMIGMNLTG